mgnify:CR=1 FL=1
MFDGRKFRQYVDGKLQKDQPELGGEYQPSPYPFLVGASRKSISGANVVAQYFFAGVIDEVRISKVACYNGDFTPAKRFEPDADTIGLYHFDEGEGDIAHDSSGNDHHGKVIAAKWFPAGRKAPKANAGAGLK